MSNLLKHAERELSLVGYDGKDEYNNMAKNAIMELLEVFHNQGHSGFSANYVSDIFNKLSRYEVLSPLTGNENEWGKEHLGDGMYQNLRDSAVFKIEGGKSFYNNAFIWEQPDGVCYTNNKSRGYIKSFPFTPKTFYIKVDGEGNIIDKEEYNKAMEYYE